LGSPTITCIDEIADIDVSARDDAAKWRVDVLEGFKLFQAANVRLCGGYGGTSCGIIAHGIIDFLFRYAVGLDQLFISRGGDARKTLVGLHGAKIGARLRKLLVHLRCFDVGQQFALLHVATNVVVPLFEVAGGSRVNGRLRVGLQR